MLSGFSPVIREPCPHFSPQRLFLNGSVISVVPSSLSPAIATRAQSDADFFGMTRGVHPVFDEGVLPISSYPSRIISREKMNVISC